MDSHAEPRGLTAAEWLSVNKVFIERYTELTLRILEKDLRQISSLDIVDQMYKKSYWKQFAHALGEAGTKLEETARASVNDEEKWNLILEEFGHLFPDLPSTAIKQDVKARLDWFKRRIAKEFEGEFTRLINANTISSPIEQIFLLEWKFAGLDKKLDVHLTPHEPIQTDVGSYAVDFLIVPKDHTLQTVKIAIELDGHEFHEKTKDQVRKDKVRERAIVQQGVTVLRFSGSEVVRNGRGCVEEVEKFLRKRLQPPLVPTTTTG